MLTDLKKLKTILKFINYQREQILKEFLKKNNL
jgi:hypothetical protein